MHTLSHIYAYWSKIYIYIIYVLPFEKNIQFRFLKSNRQPDHPPWEKENSPSFLIFHVKNACQTLSNQFSNWWEVSNPDKKIENITRLRKNRFPRKTYLSQGLVSLRLYTAYVKYYKMFVFFSSVFAHLIPRGACATRGRITINRMMKCDWQGGITYCMPAHMISHPHNWI